MASETEELVPAFAKDLSKETGTSGRKLNRGVFFGRRTVSGEMRLWQPLQPL